MPLTILEHALGAHILAQLRDEATPPERFRTLSHSLTQLLVAEATRTLPLCGLTVRTPLEEAPGQRLAHTPVLVPVLRAGLGMLDAALGMLPDATVGYVGLARDEETAIAAAYYSKLPDLEGRVVLLLDPMLATGGSAGWAANHLYLAGAAEVRLLCVVAAPEGVERLAESFPALTVFAAALDRELDARSYILPGLGDYGDRLYGTFAPA